MDKIAIKKELKQRIERIHFEINELKEIVKPISPENAIGRISRMDAINNKSVNEATLRTKKQTLSNLNFALSHINDVDFGICVKCNQPIPEGRILLLPQARKCVNCS
jgi:DnaK suppressor protein